MSFLPAPRKQQLEAAYRRELDELKTVHLPRQAAAGAYEALASAVPCLRQNHSLLVYENAPAKHVKMMVCKTAGADRFLPTTPDGIRRHSAG